MTDESCIGKDLEETGDGLIELIVANNTALLFCP
jgi:hypothetical protein